MALGAAGRRLDGRVKIAWLLPIYVFALIVLLIGIAALLALPWGERSFLLPSLTNGAFVPLSVILIELLVLVPSLIWAQFRYNAFTYMLEESELVIKDGIINRQTIVVPYERVQQIYTERTLRDRILSLATLRLETAAQDTSIITAVLPGIAYEERDALVEEIMSHVTRHRGGMGEQAGGGEQYENAVLKELKNIHGLLQEQATSEPGNEKIKQTLAAINDIVGKHVESKPSEETMKRTLEHLTTLHETIKKNMELKEPDFETRRKRRRSDDET